MSARNVNLREVSNLKMILSGKVTAINADKSPSIEITQIRVNDLKHPWKLRDKVFLEINVELTDIYPPNEIKIVKSVDQRL